MYVTKHRAFHNKQLKSTTVHESYCSSYMNRNPNTDTGVWQEGTREELEAEARRLGHKIKTHSVC